MADSPIGPRGPEPRSGNGRRTHDAVWWVVLHQGALDYTRSVAGYDDASATRLLDSLRAGVDARDA